MSKTIIVIFAAFATLVTALAQAQAQAPAPAPAAQASAAPSPAAASATQAAASTQAASPTPSQHPRWLKKVVIISIIGAAASVLVGIVVAKKDHVVCRSCVAQP